MKHHQFQNKIIIINIIVIKVVMVVILVIDNRYHYHYIHTAPVNDHLLHCNKDDCFINNHNKNNSNNILIIIRVSCRIMGTSTFLSHYQ